MSERGRQGRRGSAGRCHPVSAPRGDDAARCCAQGMQCAGGRQWQGAPPPTSVSRKWPTMCSWVRSKAYPYHPLIHRLGSALAVTEARSTTFCSSRWAGSKWQDHQAQPVGEMLEASMGAGVACSQRPHTHPLSDEGSGVDGGSNGLCKDHSHVLEWGGLRFVAKAQLGK